MPSNFEVRVRINILQRYPRVYLRESDNLGTNASGSGELVVDKEVMLGLVGDYLVIEEGELLAL